MMRGQPYFGPRALLRKLREIMKEPISAQDRLNKIVSQIAANMVAEVCSLYVLRSDDVLELFATEGLNPGAVHNTSLKVGEGLVGRIAAEAETLSLADAQKHPAFAYRPETGEEIYHGFLGVPVLRAGRTLGVLVVQNRAQRHYSEEEVDILQTAVMLLAEMIASGEVGAPKRGALDTARSQHLQGVSLADGVGLGKVVLHEPRIVVTNLIAEDSEKERQRLDKAIAGLRLSIDDMLDHGPMQSGGEHRDVLEAYRMFAYDRGWARRMHEAIDTGLTAEAAVERVQSDTRARMQRATDPYIRERLHDFEALAYRLLRELMGKAIVPLDEEAPKNAILVARTMGPADLLEYRKLKLRGVVLEEGGPTSHVTIVAKALGIPAVGQVSDIVGLAETGDDIIVDGESGDIHLRPPNDIEAAYAEKVKFRARKQEQYRLLRDQVPMTRDGTRITMYMNAGLVVDLPHLDDVRADGIGLFRTELQFMVATAFPRMSEQMRLYSQVLDAAGDLPVVFRSLDIGGDKVLPYIRQVSEENPALGWRAIRLGLDRPGLLRTQMRALLHAAAGRELRLMFPMVSDVSEIHKARAILHREVRHLTRHGYALPQSIKIGAMIEVPSLLYQLDEFMDAVDFASVGSNDLFQFFMAVDRGNTRMARYFDQVSAPFLRALQDIAQAADRHDVPLTLCGELASRPIAAMALLGLGYRAISMSPTGFGRIKTLILKLDLVDFREAFLPFLEKARAGDDLPEFLRDYAKAHDIPY